VIGASRFSPRPTLGYRFHSLQVEIITFPLRHPLVHLILPRAKCNIRAAFLL
jgi:hypothetical protein